MGRPALMLAHNRNGNTVITVPYMLINAPGSLDAGKSRSIRVKYHAIANIVT